MKGHRWGTEFRAFPAKGFFILFVVRVILFTTKYVLSDQFNTSLFDAFFPAIFLFVLKCALVRIRNNRCLWSLAFLSPNLYRAQCEFNIFATGKLHRKDKSSNWQVSYHTLENGNVNIKLRKQVTMNDILSHKTKFDSRLKNITREQKSDSKSYPLLNSISWKIN